MEELVLTIVGVYSSIKLKLIIRQVSKFSYKEYFETQLSRPENYYLVKKVILALKKNIKSKKTIKNSWKRKLHTEDEEILIC
tara:strand:+ start:939 stop:1184 length:246 start_codon:yes stop_codon:yes gene_type:complete